MSEPRACGGEAVAGPCAGGDGERLALIALAAECGLANRLKLLANVHALAAVMGAGFGVHWQAAPGCNARFEDLFEPRERLPRQAGDAWAPGWRCVDAEQLRALTPLWRSPRAHPFHYGATLRGLAARGYAAALVDAPGTSDLTLDGIAPPQLLAHKRRFYAALPWHGTLRERARRVRRAWPVAPGTPVVGVHVRAYAARHDAADGIDFEGLSPLASFRRVLEAFAPPVRFAVCSNDPDAVAAACNWFDDGRAFAARTGAATPSRDAAAGVRDALVDLLLLGSCEAVVGTYRSSFSDEAALLGGARARYCPLGAAGLADAARHDYHAAGYALDAAAGVVHLAGDAEVLARLRQSAR